MKKILSVAVIAAALAAPAAANETVLIEGSDTAVVGAGDSNGLGLSPEMVVFGLFGLMVAIGSNS